MTTEPQTPAAQWVGLFAQELGVTPPTDEEVGDLLAIAGMAAHSSERTAAPLSTWLAGRAGVSAVEAKDAAKRVASALGAGNLADGHRSTSH